MAIPRWGFPEINFFEVDPEEIKTQVITGFEAVSGQSLAAGDPRRLFLLSIADRIIHLQNCINIAGQQNLLTYAEGENLDGIGVLFSADRLGASHALTTLEFTLTQAMGSDYAIPKGFEVTNGIVTFATDDEIIIPAGEMTGAVNATCTEPGAIGNDYLVGQITTIVKPMAYLHTAKNTTITSGGAGIETDEEYAERLHLATDSFSVAGPKAAYEFYARSVSSSIIDVSVYSPRPCEVEIFPLMIGGKIPSPDLIEKITEYFSQEDVVPLTDKVTVLAPTPVQYSINVEYYITSEDLKKSETIHKAVENAVNEYILWQQTEVGKPITPDYLIYLVKKAGAFNVDLTTLSPSAFVNVGYGQVAQCTDIVINYKGVIG